MFETILLEVEKHLGVSAIKGAHERAGYFLLEFADRLEVWVKDLDPGVFMQSIICPMISSSNYEEFYSLLMRANFLGQGTGGAVIGIDPDEKFLTLSHKIPYEINYKIFRDELEKFLNYLSYWREEIKNHEARQV